MKIPSIQPFVCAAAAISLFALPSAYGQLHAIADFSGGVGTTNPSTQFVGAAGEGWNGPWSTSSLNTTVTPTVTNTNPIFGDENYLQMSIQGGTGTDTRRSALNRQFNTDLASGSHTISFSLRFDSLEGFGSNDFIGIFATNNAVTNTTSTSSQTWGIFITGSTGSISFRGGPADGDSVSTGITLVAGVTYNFVLNIDPENLAWQGNLTTSNNQSFSSGTLAYRSNTVVGRTFNLNTVQNSSADNWTYSLSGLTVVPEPASVAAISAFGGLLVLLILRRRRIAKS